MQENSGKENQYGKKRARIQRNNLNQNIKKNPFKTRQENLSGKNYSPKVNQEATFSPNWLNYAQLWE